MSAAISIYAWSLGWRGHGLIGIFVAVLVGQLSVGWSNDAFDSELDQRVARMEKPTVQGTVTVRVLWIGASCALGASVALSWWVAGWIGGSFHVLSLAMAWLYNTVLSRTAWSWLPYAIAFGALPPFLSIGLDGSWPVTWSLILFPIVGVSAHLANALPDFDADLAAGVNGAVIRLGRRRAALLCWFLLAVGSGILFAAALPGSLLLAAVIAVGYLLALAYASHSSSRSAMFHGLVLAVAVDVVVMVLLTYTT